MKPKSASPNTRGLRLGTDFKENLPNAPAILRVPILALEYFFADNGTVRAAALTYTTLLAIVPMLAFAFASLRGTGPRDARSGWPRAAVPNA